MRLDGGRFLSHASVPVALTDPSALVEALEIVRFQPGTPQHDVDVAQVRRERLREIGHRPPLERAILLDPQVVDQDHVAAGAAQLRDQLELPLKGKPAIHAGLVLVRRETEIRSREVRIEPEQDRLAALDAGQDVRRRLPARLVEDPDAVVALEPLAHRRRDVRANLDRPDPLELGVGRELDAVTDADPRPEQVAAALRLHQGLQVEEAQRSHGVR